MSGTWTEGFLDCLDEDKPMIDYGKQGAIPLVEVKCGSDEFENQIRVIGATFACEWFGHEAGSDFTRDTIRTLCARSGINPLIEGEG